MCFLFFNSGRYFGEGVFGRAPVMTICTLQYSGGVTTVFCVYLIFLPKSNLISADIEVSLTVVPLSDKKRLHFDITVVPCTYISVVLFLMHSLSSSITH